MSETDTSGRKRRGKKPDKPAKSAGGPVKVQKIAIEDIKMHPAFVDLLPGSEDMVETMAQSMGIDGFFESEAITLGTWPGQEEPVVIDGHMRIRAAIQAGLTHIPCVLVAFESEIAGLQRAIDLQTKRRPTTDGAPVSAV